MSGQATRGFAPVVRTSSPTTTLHCSSTLLAARVCNSIWWGTRTQATSRQAVSGYLCVSGSLGPAYKCPLTADNRSERLTMQHLPQPGKS